ncbi:MAG: BUG/TctC family periplasmic protein, partial [uncultured Acetobacteraceae bacterium]
VTSHAPVGAPLVGAGPVRALPGPCPSARAAVAAGHAGAHHRSRCAGRHHRHHGPALRAAPASALGRPGGRREPVWRRGHHRHPGGDPRRAGRPDPALGQHRAAGDRLLAVPQPAVPGRPDRARVGPDPRAERAGGERRVAGADDGGVRRAAPPGARARHLRLHRRRAVHALVAGVDAATAERPGDPRAFPRLRAGADGAAGGQRAVPGGQPDRRDRADPRGPAARPRGDGRRAQRGIAGRADHAGSRAGTGELRGEHLVRPLRARRHAGARRARDQRRHRRPAGPAGHGAPLHRVGRRADARAARGLRRLRAGRDRQVARGDPQGGFAARCGV